MPASAVMNILVYNGPGVSHTSLTHTISSLNALARPYLSVQTIGPNALARHPWAPSCALLVIPGGRDVPYLKSLSEGDSGSANAAIKSYVQGGGKFLGLCAGAYYASRTVDWERGRAGYQILGERPLRFFNGTCKGSVYPGFEYEIEAGARAVQLVLEDDGSEIDAIYFNGGGEFVMDPESSTGVQVLARYLDSDQRSKVAGVSCQVGKGRAVLWGVHPEYPLQAEPAVRTLHARSFTPEQIVQAESQRLSLLQRTLDCLGIGGPAVAKENAPRAPLPQIFTCSLGDQSATVMKALSPNLRADKDNSFTLADMRNIIHIHQHETETTLKDFIDTARETAKPLPPPAAPGQKEEKIHSDVVFSPVSALSQGVTPLFDIPQFFLDLKQYRPPGHPAAKPRAGDILLYGEAVESTQTFLDRSGQLCLVPP